MATPFSAPGSTTTGTVVTSSPMSVTPAWSPGTGQLLVAIALVVKTAASGAALPATPTDGYSSGGTWHAFGNQQILNTGSSPYLYLKSYYKVTNSFDADPTNGLQGHGLSVTFTATSTSGAAVTVLGVNGFVETPTLDGAANNTGSSGGSPTTTDELSNSPAWSGSFSQEVFIGFGAWNGSIGANNAGWGYSSSGSIFTNDVSSGTPTISTARAGWSWGVTSAADRSTALNGGSSYDAFIWNWTSTRSDLLGGAIWYDPAIQPLPPSLSVRQSVNRAATFFSRVPWKERASGLQVPGFADRRLVVA